MAWVEQSVEIDASLETVWGVVTDYLRYPMFLEGMKSAKVVSEEGGKKCVEFELQLIKRIRYTLCFDSPETGRLSWTLVRGDFMRRNEGGWDLVSLGADRCKATYRIAIAFGAIVPESITRSLASKNLPATLAAFKARAEGMGSI